MGALRQQSFQKELHFQCSRERDLVQQTTLQVHYVYALHYCMGSLINPTIFLNHTKSASWKYIFYVYFTLPNVLFYVEFIQCFTL